MSIALTSRDCSRDGGGGDDGGKMCTRNCFIVRLLIGGNGARDLSVES